MRNNYLLALFLFFSSGHTVCAQQIPDVSILQHEQQLIENVVRKLQGAKNITTEKVAELLTQESSEIIFEWIALAILTPCFLLYSSWFFCECYCWCSLARAYRRAHGTGYDEVGEGE